MNESSDKGAGTFIIQWIILLFSWTIPLILAECKIGKRTMKSIILSAIQVGGEKCLWIGCFIQFVPILIGFYYVAITGWTLYYFCHSLFFTLPTTLEESLFVWNDFHNSAVPAFMSIISIVMAALIAFKQWEDRIGIILVPFFLALTLLIWIGSFLLPHGTAGMKFMFTVEWSQLLSGESWMAALSQNVWDTGAGYGLFLVLSQKKTFNRIRSGVIPPLINNIVSLMISMAIFSIAFSHLKSMEGSEILDQMKSSGIYASGLSYIWTCILFSQLGPFVGRIVAIIFFALLTCCALCFLASIISLSVHALNDIWDKDRRVIAMLIVIIPTILISILPSLNINFLLNQDFVWGRGLVISGILYLGLILLTSTRPKFAWKPRVLWKIFKRYFFITEAFIIVVWWLIETPFTRKKDLWYHPFVARSLATCIFQFALLVVAALGVTALYCVRNSMPCLFVYNKLKNNNKEEVELEDIDSDAV